MNELVRSNRRSEKFIYKKPGISCAATKTVPQFMMEDQKQNLFEVGEDHLERKRASNADICLRNVVMTWIIKSSHRKPEAL